jgi:4-carboxymuconolactone decarboxylase
MPAKKKPDKKMPAKKNPAKTTRNKSPNAMAPCRLPPVADEAMTPAQRGLMQSISSGPRGRFKMSGPFFCYLHAPAFGELAQKLGAHCRFGTGIAPRLSEFAILATARHWKSQYEWAAHVGIAEQKGVKTETIRDLRAGRYPKKAPEDERSIYDFIAEVYRHKRVGDRTYKAVQALLGDTGMVELVGLLGYYALVAMTLDVFRMPIPDGTPLPFTEPAIR